MFLCVCVCIVDCLSKDLGRCCSVSFSFDMFKFAASICSMVLNFKASWHAFVDVCRVRILLLGVAMPEVRTLVHLSIL